MALKLIKRFSKPPLFFILALGLVLAGTLYSQQLPILKIGLREGLPQSTVLRMKQDKTGYMWFATQGGLCRYDGISFKVYSQFDGIGSNFIRDLDFDSKGQIWVSTIDKGISCYNGEKFIQFNRSTGLLTDQTRNFIKTSSGDYFICSVDLGVIWADKYLNQKQIFTPEGEIISYARKAIEVPNGNIWIAYANGIIELQKKRNYAPRHILKNKFEVISLFKDIKGDIWAAGTNTIVEFVKDTFTDYSNILPLGTDVWDIWEESTTGKMFFATSNGLLIKYRDDITWLTTFNGLSVNDLRSLYHDKNNNLWAGTMGGGAMIIENKGIDHFTYTSEINGFAANTIAEDGDGNVWIGTNNQGIIYSDKKETKNSSFIRSSDMKDALSSTSDRKTGDVWMADYDGKIIRISEGRIKWKWTPKHGILRLLNINYANDQLYISTQNGFYTLSEKDNQLKKIDELGNNYFSYSFSDKRGNIWVLGDGGVIYRITNGKVLDYTSRINPEHASVTQGLYDPYHHLYWFCSYSGLLVWDNKRVYKLHSKNGISSDSPWSIAQDHNGDIWIGLPNGIERISYRTRSTKTFGYDQGFTPIETNSCAIHCDRKGNIWFGTVNSATRIRVNDISLRKSIANLCIQKIWANEKILFEQNLMDHERKELVLSYNKNNLRLDLTGICYENAKDVSYSWYLQGFDEKWTKWDNGTSAIYSNLKPGTYVFKAKAMDPNGYQTQPISIKIIIKKPIWNYWWFYLVEVAVMGFIIYLSFRYTADTEKNKLGNILTLVSILIIFEGALIYVSDYIDKFTAGIPIFQLIMNVILAATLHPIEMSIRKFMRKWAIKKRRKSLHPEGIKQD
jgi:ligand-binding sensor domain-containing protein